MEEVDLLLPQGVDYHNKAAVTMRENRPPAGGQTGLSMSQYYITEDSKTLLRYL